MLRGSVREVDDRSLSPRCGGGYLRSHCLLAGWSSSSSLNVLLQKFPWPPSYWTGRSSWWAKMHPYLRALADSRRGREVSPG